MLIHLGIKVFFRNLLKLILIDLLKSLDSSIIEKEALKMEEVKVRESRETSEEKEKIEISPKIKKKKKTPNQEVIITIIIKIDKTKREISQDQLNLELKRKINKIDNKKYILFIFNHF